MSKRKLAFTIIANAILLSILFGLIQDQLTIRICPEYFTQWHPNILGIQNLTLLALYWGVIATWWVGLILGIALSLVAVLGARPIPSIAYIRTQLFWILAIAACCAILAGVIAALSHFIAPVYVMGDIAQMSASTKRAFSIDLAIHNAAYDSAAIASMISCIHIWRARKNSLPRAFR